MTENDSLIYGEAISRMTTGRGRECECVRGGNMIERGRKGKIGKDRLWMERRGDGGVTGGKGMQGQGAREREMV